MGKILVKYYLHRIWYFQQNVFKWGDILNIFHGFVIGVQNFEQSPSIIICLFIFKICPCSFLSGTLRLQLCSACTFSVERNNVSINNFKIFIQCKVISPAVFRHFTIGFHESLFDILVSVYRRKILFIKINYCSLLIKVFWTSTTL